MQWLYKVTVSTASSFTSQDFLQGTSHLVSLVTLWVLKLDLMARQRLHFDPIKHIA